MISSPLVAVSRQAGVATDRTVAEVTGAGAGRVAGGRATVAPAGSPPDRADPSANPSTMPTARVTAEPASSGPHRVRRDPWTAPTGRPPASGEARAMSLDDEPAGFNLEHDDAWIPRLAEVIARRTPSLAEVGVAGGCAGLYEVTPDHNALIGEAPRPARLYATGFSGHGFLQGPAVGEVVRDLFLGRRPAVDVAPLAADRFQHGRAGPC